MVYVDIRDDSLGLLKSGVRSKHVKIGFFNLGENDGIFVPADCMRPFWLQVGDYVVLKNGFSITIDSIGFDHELDIHYVDYRFPAGDHYRTDVNVLVKEIVGYA